MDDSIRNAIVRIDLVEAGIRGTGFLVSDELVATALHVVADRTTTPLKFYSGIIQLRFPYHTIEAEVMEGGWDEDNDCVLLRCKEPPNFRPLALGELRTSKGQWETHGFPAMQPADGMTLEGHVANHAGKLYGKPTIQLYCKQAAAGVGGPLDGASGAPVIIDGVAVGLLRFELLQNGLITGGTVYACKSQFVVDLCPDLLRLRPTQDFYNLPSLPTRYEPRERDLVDVRTKLLSAEGAVANSSAARAVGIHGMVGIGKTVLAAALVHDPELRAAFPDGIVWLSFGRHAQVLAKAVEFSFALTRTRTSYDTVSEARGQLGLGSANKRLLVVLDDIWEPAAADPFTGLAPGCRLLITTRDTRVLERTQAEGHRLDILDHSSGLLFLAKAVGIGVDALPKEADQIVTECGSLPLAIAAVGSLIQRGVYGWKDAIEALQNAELENLDTGWLPDPEQRNLAVILQLSVDALTDDVRRCFFACAILPEDAGVPEAALLQLWSTLGENERRRKRIAQELFDRSLMQRDEQRRYRIHDFYMDYLKHAAAPLSERHRRAVECYRSVCPNGWASGPDDGYFLQYLPWHLREAGQTDELRSLLFDFTWLRVKFVACGAAALIEDLRLLEGDREATQLAAALRLSTEALESDPKQIGAQILGRLVAEDGSTIEQLLATIRHDQALALIPVKDGYLTRPGPIQRTFWTNAEPLILALAALPDGRHALFVSAEGIFRVWDLERGSELRRFGDDIGVLCNAVAVLPGGRRALSGWNDGALRLWDLESEAELRRFDHGGKVTAIAVLSDGSQALSASTDRTVRLWDLESGAELWRFEHDDTVTAIAVLPGRRILLGSVDGTLRLWDLERRTERRRFEHGDEVEAIAVLRDGRRALSMSTTGALRLWELGSGTELRRFGGDDHSGRAFTVIILPDARHALSASTRTLRLWELETGTELRRFGDASSLPLRPITGGYFTAVAVLPDGRRALSMSTTGALRLWDLEIGAAPHRHAHDGYVTAVAVLPNGHRALSATVNTTLALWDLDSGARLHRPGRWFRGARQSRVQRSKSLSQIYPSMVRAVLPDGRHALSADQFGEFTLWDLKSGAELRRFKHGGEVAAIAVLPDGRRALSGSTDGTLRLWDLKSGAQLRELKHTRQVGGEYMLGNFKSGQRPYRVVRGDAVLAVAVLPDERRALSGSVDGKLLLWDLESGHEQLMFECGGAGVTAVVVRSDGSHALVASGDGKLRLWDLKRVAEVRQFEHDDIVTAVAVLPDGCRALSGSADRTLRLWDLEDGTELARFVSDDPITAVSANEYRAIIGDTIGRVMIFHITL